MQMDWSRVITIAVGIAGLIAGWALGFFDSKLRADKKIKQAEEKAQAAIRQAQGEAERAILSARAASSPAPSGKTLLRLWLNEAEQPALDLDGQTVPTSPLSELHRKRLLALLNVMRPWIEHKPAASAAPANAAPLEQPARAPAPIPPVVVTPKQEEKPAAPMSIVAQIDEILQMKLIGTPLASRSIRLQESPEGGVLVWVGMKRFDGVADVSDPDVQAILRAAIAEWEKRYTPGER